MLLWYEQTVEIPETRLDEPVRRHLGETTVQILTISPTYFRSSVDIESLPHLEEDVSEFLSNLH